MQYKRYLTLVFDKYRVDFNNWPYDILIQHPSHMTSKQRERLLVLFRHKLLNIRPVSDDEYETRRSVRQDNVIKPGPRQRRSDVDEPRIRTNPRTMKKRLWPRAFIRNVTSMISRLVPYCVDIIHLIGTIQSVFEQYLTSY